MRCPELYPYLPQRLQKLSPFRGRKRFSEICIVSILSAVYKSYPRLGDGNKFFRLFRYTHILERLQKLSSIRGRKLNLIYTAVSLPRCLQKLTPIRGRKEVVSVSLLILQGRLQKLPPFRGRKPNLLNFINYSLFRLQKLTPVRGRKPFRPPDTVVTKYARLQTYPR